MNALSIGQSTAKQFLTSTRKLDAFMRAILTWEEFEKEFNLGQEYIKKHGKSHAEISAAAKSLKESIRVTLATEFTRLNALPLELQKPKWAFCKAGTRVAFEIEEVKTNGKKSKTGIFIASLEPGGWTEAAPADEPPADEPPADEPPADEPPAEPSDEPPADEPPADEPPADEPPAEPSDDEPSDEPPADEPGLVTKLQTRIRDLEAENECLRQLIGGLAHGTITAQYALDYLTGTA